MSLMCCRCSADQVISFTLTSSQLFKDINTSTHSICTYSYVYVSALTLVSSCVPRNTPHMNLCEVLSALSRHTVVVSCWVSSRCAVMLCLRFPVLWIFWGGLCSSYSTHHTFCQSLSLSRSLSVYHVHPHPLFLSGSVFSPPLKSLWKPFFFLLLLSNKVWRSFWKCLFSVNTCVYVCKLDLENKFLVLKSRNFSHVLYSI